MERQAGRFAGQTFLGFCQGEKAGRFRALIYSPPHAFGGTKPKINYDSCWRRMGIAKPKRIPQPFRTMPIPASKRLEPLLFLRRPTGWWNTLPT